MDADDNRNEDDCGEDDNDEGDRQDDEMTSVLLSEAEGSLADAVADPATGGLAAGRGGLAPPSAAALALAAESKGRVGGGATRALTAPLLREDDGESAIAHVRTSLHSQSGFSDRQLMRAMSKVRQGVRTQSLRARTSGGRDGTSPVR